MKHLIALGLLLSLTGCVDRLGGFTYTIKDGEVTIKADTVYGGPDVVVEKGADGSTRVVIDSPEPSLPIAP